jgi:CHAT domain-containing protein
VSLSVLVLIATVPAGPTPVAAADDAEVPPGVQRIVDRAEELGELDEVDSAALVPEVLELAESETDDPSAAVSALAQFGKAAISGGRFETARAVLEPALTLAENVAPGTVAEADVLGALGSLAAREESLPTAVEFRTREIELRRRLQPGSLELADALNSIGVAQTNLGQLGPAKEAHEEALTIRREKVPETEDVAESLNNLGLVALWGGDVQAARELLTEAFELREKIDPGSAASAETMVNIGNISAMMADYPQARDDYRRAAAIFEEVCPECKGYGKALGNLREVLYRQGDLAGAEEVAKRSLPFFEKNFPDSTSLSFEYVGMGNLALYHGKAEEAESWFRKALDIRSRHVPGSHLHAECLHNLAHVSLYLGRFDEARDYQIPALEIIEPFFGVTWATAHNYHTLGTIEWSRLDLDAAEEALRKSISIAEQALGPDHPQAGDALSTLAGVLAMNGKIAESMECALRAERIAREHLRLTARKLPEREALLYDVLELAGREMALSLAADPRGEAAAAWDTLIRSRALVLDEMAARHRAIFGATDSDVDRLARDLEDARTHLAELVVAGPGEAGSDEHGASLQEARQAKERLETALADNSARFRIELRRSRAGLEEVTAALGETDALVAYAHYARLVLRPGEDGKTSQREFDRAYVAFVLPPGGESPVAIDLGSASDIDALVADLQDHLEMVAMAPDRSPKRSESSYRDKASALGEKIWTPLLPHLKKAGKVFVVPDGALNFVNFAALPRGESGYLVDEGPVLHYLSAERDLLVPDAPDGAGSLLVLANPAFDDTAQFAALAPKDGADTETAPVLVASAGTYRGQRAACGDFDTLKFAPLPASAKESEEVVAIWSATGKPGEDTDKPVTALAGPAASEARFKADAANARVLHLATHGFFLTGDCTSSRDVVRERDPGDCSETVVGENPLLLAGLAMAGANHRDAAGPEEEDGILTAEEIAALDLSGAEWAVLSACDTGLGEVKAGEGVLGLRRAFQVAGARTLIMSLWRVDDEATRQWMSALYRHRFEGGLGTAEATRAASLDVLKARRENEQSTHPIHWAGFVAAGDWR